MTNPAEKIRQVVYEAQCKVWDASASGALYEDDSVVTSVDAVEIQKEALAAQLDAIIEEMERDISLANENLGIPGYDELRHITYVAAIERHLNPLKEARTSITNSTHE